jgi:DNA-binding response OmpR family regulator
MVGRMRILLLEDEPKFSSRIERCLTAEHYAVDALADGREGLEFAQIFPYDLILLDLMLPSMSGAQVLQVIRRHNQQVPVLVLTARDSIEDKVQLFQLGADDYLTKPFASVELIMRVKALLRRGPVNRSSTIRIQDLELDRLTHQVKRQGKRISLTSKEYALLEYLMMNPDRVLSRSMLVEHVWDHTFDAITNVVDVYVAHLRRKMDESFEPKLIETVRGAGYLIQSESP